MVSGLPVVTTSACGYAGHIRSAHAGLVLDEPFSAEALVEALMRTMEADFRQTCRDSGLAYAAREDLYSMHTTAASLIESAVRRKRLAAHD